MSENSGNAMEEMDRRRFSLTGRVFHATLLGSLILGLIVLIIGLGLYTYALVGQYISQSYSISCCAASICEKLADVESFSDSVMGRYRSLSDSEIASMGSRDYRNLFSDLEENPAFGSIHFVLHEFLDAGDVDAVYLAAFDEEKGRIVYLVDPDDVVSKKLMPGDWQEFKAKTLKKFMHWDGKGKLYDIGKTEIYGWLCMSAAPIKRSDGSTVAFVITDVSLKNFRVGVRTFLIQYVIAMFILINAFCFLMTKHMKKRMVVPINSITQAAQDYILDKCAGISGNNHFAALQIKTGDELENLSVIMAEMEKSLADYEESLTLVTAEKERIGTELSLATRIQADMLPSDFPAFPDRNEFDIYASMNPAREVGGDFYDFILIDDDHLCLVIADVSGKGVPAALFMMASKIILANTALMNKFPAEILEYTNDLICQNNTEDMFVTVWLGILEISTGKMKAANAGHEYPVIKKKDGQFEILEDKHGFVIGGLEGMKYSEYDLELSPGSKLFVYTDGVPEATDSEGKMFGPDRMLDALNRASDESPYLIITHVQDAVNGFVNGAEQFDDMTMLCFEYKGGASGDGNGASDVLEIEADTSRIHEVYEYIEKKMDGLHCSQKSLMEISVAVEEIFVNIANYAYAPGKGNVIVNAELSRDRTSLTISFSDSGKEFNPLDRTDPDITLSAEERDIGGLGIYMTKQMMDEVFYEYRDGHNVLTLRKDLES